MSAYIESSQVLTTAKQLLRITNTDQDIFLDSLIIEGARGLSTNETLILKNCERTVNDSKFYLPSDAKRIVAFRFSNSCIPGFFVDFDFFTQCGCNLTQPFNPLVGMLDIQGRWAYFIASIADGTEVQLSYQAINTDKNGMAVINEEMETALSRYAAWQYAVSYPEIYNRVQIDQWERRYREQADKCRGLAGRRKFEQQRVQIQQKINQMVNTSIPMSVLSGAYNSFLYPTFTSI